MPERTSLEPQPSPGALPRAPRAGFGCSQRAAWPGQAFPPASARTRSTSALRVSREPCREGRQQSLSWIQLGRRRAAVPGPPSRGKVLAKGGWRLPRTHSPRGMSPLPRSHSGPKQGHPGWPESTGMERSPRRPQRGSGMAGSRGKSGDFQRTKRLLAASTAGRASPPRRSSWGRRKCTKSAGSLCFISLATPAPSQGWPGQNVLLREAERWGQAQQHPVHMG